MVEKGYRPSAPEGQSPVTPPVDSKVTDYIARAKAEQVAREQRSLDAASRKNGNFVVRAIDWFKDRVGIRPKVW